MCGTGDVLSRGGDVGLNSRLVRSAAGYVVWWWWCVRCNEWDACSNWVIAMWELWRCS